MPMYEYQCDDCGHRFDIRQSFDDEPLTSCPECTGHVRRVIHPTGVIFKGSGWYITDSRKPNPASASSNGDAASSDSSNEKSTEAKSDSTSESKTESKTSAND